MLESIYWTGFTFFLLFAVIPGKPKVLSLWPVIKNCAIWPLLLVEYLVQLFRRRRILARRVRHLQQVSAAERKNRGR